MRVVIVVSWIVAAVGSLALAALAWGEISELQIEIQEPNDGQVIWAREATVDVKGIASILGDAGSLDLIFVIDTSRSLRDSDPYEYRLRGAEDLIESLPFRDAIRIGVVSFDRRAELVVPLTSSRKEAADGLRHLDRYGFTDIAAGVRLALATFESESREGVPRTILVLTDGRSNAEEVRAVGREARDRGVAIHALLLGSDSHGRKSLTEMSEATGGRLVPVDDPKELPPLFVDLRPAAVEQVTLRVNGADPVPGHYAAGNFEAPVLLREGMNRIVAIATSLDGQTRSDAVTVILRAEACGELLVEARVDGAPALAVSGRSVEIILDSSNSMWATREGRSKAAIARETLEDVLEWIPPEMKLSLRAYGHQHARELRRCEDSQLLVASGTGNREQIRREVSRIRPTGWTPLAYSLSQVASDFAGVEGERSVILLTDGIESCRGDAPAAARALQAAGPVPVHVIGFGLESSRDSDIENLRAIAEASAGRFFVADNAVELHDALVTSVGTPFTVTRDGVEVAAGRVGSTESLRLPPGPYTVTLQSEPPLTVPIEVAGEARRVLSFGSEQGVLSHGETSETIEYYECQPPRGAP